MHYHIVTTSVIITKLIGTYRTLVIRPHQPDVRGLPSAWQEGDQALGKVTDVSCLHPQRAWAGE